MSISDALRRLAAPAEVEPAEPDEGKEGVGEAPETAPAPPGHVGPAGAADFHSEPVEAPCADPALTVVFEDGRQVTVPLLGGETLAVERSWREDGLEQHAPLWSGALAQISEIHLRRPIGTRGGS